MGQNYGPIFAICGPKKPQLGLFFSVESSPNLVVVYGSDRSLQRRFLIDDILFQSGDICNEVAKSHSWN